jgi:hypothetical protein
MAKPVTPNWPALPGQRPRPRAGQGRTSRGRSSHAPSRRRADRGQGWRTAWEPLHARPRPEQHELASLQPQTKGFEESYGLDNLHLTIAKAYLVKLLANVRVVRWLAQNKPEYLSEFQSIAELTNLPTEVSAAAE